jgi:iron complex outermembrane recepter protein
LELSAVFTDNLSGGFSYALTDAAFVAFNDPEALQLFGNASVAGKQLPNEPKQQATLWGKVTIPVSGDINAFLRADVAYNARKYDQIYNLAYTGDQYLANLRLGFETEKWSLTAWVNNLFDDRTPSTVIRFVDQLNIPAPATGTVASTTTLRGFQYPLADKRRFGVTGKYKF